MLGAMSEPVSRASAAGGRPWRRWIGVAAIAVPLAILLALQLRTLAALQETSVVAQRSQLKSYAKAVVNGVEQLYRAKADDALRVPAAWLADLDGTALAAHFASRDASGVSLWFAVSFTRSPHEAMLFFDATGAPAADVPLQVARAVRVAAAPWRVVAEEDDMLDTAPAPVVGEQDPEARALFRPILDAAGRVIGVAGLIVDETFLRERFVPERIAAERERLPVEMRDVLETRLRPREALYARTPAPGDGVEMPMRFVLSDLALVVDAPTVTPEQWARRSLLLNLSLTLAAAGLLAVAIVAALRNAARATRLSQMKTEFVSNVSHELRTPLSSIRVFGEFLRSGRVTEPAKVREYGHFIESESRRLTQLVANILDFSRIESGQKSYRFEKVDMRELVTETLRSFEVLFEQEGFSVQLRAPDDVLPPAWADPSAVAQVLTNLLDNAVKYAGDPREIEVRIGADADAITVAVADRGRGIPPDEHERIFDKFYRVMTGLVHDEKGSGLGLAIVKHIMDAHRGSVTLRSEPGAGTTFTTRWPTRDA
jgi:signal transduction histidine kinase